MKFQTYYLDSHCLLSFPHFEYLWTRNILGSVGVLPRTLCWEHFRGHSWVPEKGKWKPLSHVQLFATPWTPYSPGNSPGQNTGVGSLSLLQWIFPTQELNQGLLHCRQILHQLSYQGRPKPQCSTERDAVTTCHVYLWSALSVCHRHQTEMQGYIADIFPATVVFLVQRFRSSGKADILKVRLID